MSIFLNIDLHFARFISELDASASGPLVHLAAACASHALQNGHVCADLALFPEVFPSDGPLTERISDYPDLSIWIESLRKSPVVGAGNEYRPLILENSRLYLHRYWNYEKELANAIMKKSVGITTIDSTNLETSISELFPAEGPNISGEWQKIAAITSLIKNLSIISGGPGTGKTSTVIKILSLVIDQYKNRPCHVALAAPTGKAAERLCQALQNADFMGKRMSLLKNLVIQTPSTIHRLLGVLPNSPYFKYNSDNPLPYDILVVDEASMIDCALMAKLFSALKPGSKIIVLGDKDQLASVEAGAIMGDICDAYASRHKRTPGFCAEISKISENYGLLSDKNETGLSDCIVELKKNYRFAENSGIGVVSDAIKKGNSNEAWRILCSNTFSDLSLHSLPESEGLPQRLYRNVVDNFTAYLTEKDPGQALSLFEEFRVLCTVRKGPFSVGAVNAVIERLLKVTGHIRPDSPWYAGRPIMVLSNDYNLNLFNGDIGIVMPAPAFSNELRAFFPGEAPGNVRSFLPQRLPAVETIFAMTVHKAQGSQFDHVLLMLPQNFSPILSRELLYTGITRAHKSCDIWCNKEVFIKSVERKISRMSGLRDRLWKIPECSSILTARLPVD
jgi:exodeoxyribonuclease V alpha subunit